MILTTVILVSREFSDFGISSLTLPFIGAPADYADVSFPKKN